MSGKYVAKEVTPSLEEFTNTTGPERLEVEPAVEAACERAPDDGSF